MSRLFGIAGVQMAVVPWDAEASVQKINDSVHQLSLSFPWVDMIIFHELAISGLVQFSPQEKPGNWDDSKQAIPGPLTDKLCEAARKEPDATPEPGQQFMWTPNMFRFLKPVKNYENDLTK